MTSMRRAFHVAAVVVCLPPLFCAPAHAWPGQREWRAALSRAAKSPATWAPLVLAAGLAAADADGEISDWAIEETPVFGSRDRARERADDLLLLSHAGMLASTLAVRDAERPWRARGERVLVAEGARLTVAAMTANLKSLSNRERPIGAEAHGTSFPSGHASGAASQAVITAGNLRQVRSAPLRRTLVGASSLVAGATAWARVESGAHYPTDVLVGAALGSFFARLAHEAFYGEHPEPPPVTFTGEVHPERVAVRLVVALW